MKRKQYNNIRFRTSSGFALPLVLLTFVLIALISSVSVRMSLMDENLGRNQTDRNISKKMAELALMDARDDLLCSKTISGYDKSDGREFYNNGTLYVDNGECVEGLCGKPNGDDDPKYWETLHSGDTEIGFARYGQFSGRDSLGTGLFGSA
ncbi:MAG: hypothetical protein RLZZ210_1396, partial [Pseudomonadota bacterium]